MHGFLKIKSNKNIFFCKVSKDATNANFEKFQYFDNMCIYKSHYNDRFDEKIIFFHKVTKDATNAHFEKIFRFLSTSAFLKIGMIVNLVKKKTKNVHMHRFYGLEVIKIFFFRKMTKDATNAHFDIFLDF